MSAWLTVFAGGTLPEAPPVAPYSPEGIGDADGNEPESPERMRIRSSPSSTRSSAKPLSSIGYGYSGGTTRSASSMTWMSSFLFPSTYASQAMLSIITCVSITKTFFEITSLDIGFALSFRHSRWRYRKRAAAVVSSPVAAVVAADTEVNSEPVTDDTSDAAAWWTFDSAEYGRSSDMMRRGGRLIHAVMAVHAKYTRESPNLPTWGESSNREVRAKTLE
mmetsp:Transcript_1980/g.5305  ORF Transcript_1980/g.5305 Transcript_1980/m.5305 type:complete len:220 (+) Transcript_1980:1981-2640(+)